MSFVDWMDAYLTHKYSFRVKILSSRVPVIFSLREWGTWSYLAWRSRVRRRNLMGRPYWKSTVTYLVLQFGIISRKAGGEENRVILAVYYENTQLNHVVWSKCIKMMFGQRIFITYQGHQPHRSSKETEDANSKYLKYFFSTVNCLSFPNRILPPCSSVPTSWIRKISLGNPTLFWCSTAATRTARKQQPPSQMNTAPLKQPVQIIPALPVCFLHSYQVVRA